MKTFVQHFHTGYLKMNRMVLIVVLLPQVRLSLSKIVDIHTDNNPGICNNSYHGRISMVIDRQSDDKLLICSQKRGVYSWKAIDGLKSPGEFFDPANDCSDILNKDSNAKDGAYWITFGGSNPKKVWCDMATDGGGYMLIGRTRNASWWKVPSKNKIVEPFGDPHWTSAFGDAPILDFRVQMATKEDFSETKAHWSFRLQAKRQLKDLMLLNQGGCGQNSAGIGNISYVKDLVSEKVVTTKLRCSKFGFGYHPLTNFGWSMKNSCLQKPCQYGFGFHNKFSLQTDYSGAFSYSVSGSVSGIEHDATAFVGCDNKHCCGCYGPVGGTKDYCTKECKPLNGGTITKDVFTWFWVRSALPKKVWSKCMEYNVVEDNGKIVWYKLLGESAVPTEGRCSKNNAFLHNGVVVVSDASTVKKIPHVAGLLAYRKDNKKLYIRANKTWSVVAQENKVFDKLKKEVENVKKELSKELKNVMDTLGKKIEQVRETFGNQIENQNRTLLKQANTYDTKFEKFKKELENEQKKLENAQKELSKKLENVNQTLREKLSALNWLPSSVILNANPNYITQIKTWFPLKQWQRCYRATKDGWAGTTFHSKCNNKGPTVTIVRVGDYVFGGYTDVSWDSSSGFKTTSNSFIFSLKNKDNLAPFKAPVYQNSEHAIYCTSSNGPTFGSLDLDIANNANSNTYSYADLGSTYQPPSGYSYRSNNTRALLAGSYHFTPSEVEVFYLR